MDNKIDLMTLKKNLRYNPQTGKWRWIIKKFGVTRGMEAGYVHGKDGRKCIEINGKGYRCAVLAWFYMTGEWPALQVDHINRNPKDDRWSNLRLATQSNNNSNKLFKRKYNLPRGVYPSVSKNVSKYQSFLRVDGIYKYLGVFDTANEAHEAWLKASNHRNGFLPQE